MHMLTGRADSSANDAMKAVAAIPVLLCFVFGAEFVGKDRVLTTSLPLAGMRRVFDLLVEPVELPRPVTIIGDNVPPLGCGKTAPTTAE